MVNGFSWTKLSYKQKYDFGVWIVASFGSVIVSTLCAVIIHQNNEVNQVRKECEKKIARARIADSTEIAILKLKREQEQTARLQDFKNRRVIDSIWLEKFEKLTNEKK